MIKQILSSVTILAIGLTSTSALVGALEAPKSYNYGNIPGLPKEAALYYTSIDQNLSSK